MYSTSHTHNQENLLFSKVGKNKDSAKTHRDIKTGYKKNLFM